MTFTTKNDVTFTCGKSFEGQLEIFAEWTEDNGEEKFGFIRLDCQDVYDFVGHAIRTTLERSNHER